MGESVKKEVQEVFEKALAGFEQRQEAINRRLRERERFETELTRIRTDVVVPALLQSIAADTNRRSHKVRRWA